MSDVANNDDPYTSNVLKLTQAHSKLIKRLCIFLICIQEENKQKRREIERDLRHIAGLDSTTIEAVERQLKAAVSLYVRMTGKAASLKFCCHYLYMCF